MYNFYIFITLNILLSVLITYLKQNILKTLTIPEEMIFSQIFFLIFFTTYYFFVDNSNLNETLDKFRYNKDNILPKMILFDFMVGFALVIGAYLLINEKIIYLKPIKIGGYLIVLSIISLFIEKKHSIYTFMGIVTILAGLGMIEYEKN